jgi:hypothetical protein
MLIGRTQDAPLTGRTSYALPFRSQAYGRGKWPRARLSAGALLALMLLSLGVAQAENRDIARRRATQRLSFTDAQIADGFFKTALGAELSINKESDRIRKYVQPVRVYVDSRAKPDRRSQVASVIADIGTRIAHLDIAMASRSEDANVTVVLVRNRDLRKTIRSIFGRRQEARIQHSLDPQCLSGLAKDASFRIQRSEVIIPADAGEFVFYDCAYEEILQSLGPIRDDSSVPWTMFNDDVQMGFFDVYDQILLNVLYHPLVRPGMTAADVRAVLPEVLPQVRAFVAKRNRLPKKLPRR